jgi:hypothetical protein
MLVFIADGKFHVSNPKSNQTQHSPSGKTDSLPHIQEMSQLLWTPKQCSQELATDPVLSQMNLLHILIAFHNKIHEQRATHKKLYKFY